MTKAQMLKTKKTNLYFLLEYRGKKEAKKKKADQRQTIQSSMTHVVPAERGRDIASNYTVDG
jgi:hypothetical protein